MLQIHLLGQFDVRLEGQRIALASRPAQSLFALLVLNVGREFRREKLAGLVWPETSEDSARKNLRQELWRIRKALASPNVPAHEFLMTEGFTVVFRRTADYWLDAAQLAQPVAGEGALGELVNQLSLYHGELLPGFYDEWVVLERERLSSIFESKMEQLLEELAAQERWTAVQEWADKWLAFGGAPEPAYRALMLAYGARGDMAKVAALYQRCKDDLQTQLGVEPSAETRALYEGLRKGAKTPLRTATVQTSGTVTFLFTDIEGSTRLLDKLRGEYASVLADQRDILRAAFQKWNGREVDTQGDAFFVSFARALDAVHCAADAQRALAAHTWTQGERVQVRMGLHTGEPLVASTGYVGMDVHRAARIGDAGHGGQVLLSQTTRELVIHELPQGLGIRELGEHRLKDLKYPTAIYQLFIEGLPNDFPPLRTKFMGTEAPTPGEPPFKGLQHFDQGDTDLFFGREELTAKLVARLRASQFLSVIVGASGSGKSSLVRAGLVPALRNLTKNGEGSAQGDGSRVIVITPTAHPLEALASALTHDSESVTATATLMDDLAKDPRSLYLFLRRGMADRRLQIADSDSPTAISHSPFAIRHMLLVVDQFEELFTLCRDELEREQFIDNLLYAISESASDAVAPSALTVVITLRADFYAHLAQYPELRDAVAKQQEYIGPMTTEELRRAIQEPARRGHWDFEPGLVDLMLRDVGDEPGALPLLSHVLLETWKRRNGHTLTLKGYHDAGGVHGAIAQTADSTYQQLLPEQQPIARNIFLRLTELGEGTEDTRRRAPIQELIPRPADAETVRAVLNVLAQARLITLGQDTAEVAHEALIREWGTLREWLNQGRDGLRLHRHLTEAAQEWELLEYDAGALYRGARLAQAREWAALNPTTLNDQERAFLEASEEQEQRETREREEQQKRELEAAQKLAEEQKGRAEEQSRTNKELRQRALLLAGAFVLAILLAVIALLLGEQARVSAVAAATSAQTAERTSRIATARELAANALGNLSVDPQRSLLLALQAVKATEADGTVLPEAQDALHRAIVSSHVETVLPHLSRVFSAMYSPDGTRIATRSEGRLILWDAKTHQELFDIPLSPAINNLNNLAYSSDGSQIATLDYDTSQASTPPVVQVLDAHSGKLLRQTQVEQEGYGMSGVGFSQDLSRVILMPYGGKPATVWNTITGAKMLTLPVAAGDFIGSNAAFSPDGKYIVAGNQDPFVKIMDAANGKEVLTLCCHGEGNGINRTLFSPDGKRIATAGDDAKIKIWEASTGKELMTLAGHTNFVINVAFSPDGNRLASASWDRKVKVWDLKTGREIYELPGHGDEINDAEFSPDGKTLVTGSADKTAMLWDVGPSRELTAIDVQREIVRAGHNPERTRLFMYLAGNVFQIWDSQSLKVLWTYTHPGPETTYDFVLSPDGKFGAFRATDQTIHLVDVESRKQIRTLWAGKDAYLWEPKFSPDSRRLAATFDDEQGPQLAIWDTQSGGTLTTFPLLNIENDYVNRGNWSPDGVRFATGYSRGPVQVWDTNTGKQLLDLPGHTNQINAIVFSQDANKLATVSQDGIAIVRDAQTGKELYRLVGHTSSVRNLDFSPDGKYIVTASADGTAKVWDAYNGRELLTLYHSPNNVSGAMFTADGRRILTTSEDGTIREYTLEIQELVDLAKARLIRTWRTDECQKYLHVDECP